eukprot:g15251.t1
MFEKAAREKSSEAEASAAGDTEGIFETPFYCIWINCYLHALQLNIKWVFKQMESFCDVRFMQTLTAWRKVIEWYFIPDDRTFSRLPEHVKTRWGSAYQAVDRLHRQEEASKKMHARKKVDPKFSPAKKNAAYFSRAGASIKTNFFAALAAGRSLLRMLDNHTRNIQQFMSERRYKFREACKRNFEMPNVLRRVFYFISGTVQPAVRVFFFRVGIGLARQMHKRELQFRRDRTESKHSVFKAIRKEAPSIGDELLSARFEIRSSPSLLPRQFGCLYKIRDHRFKCRLPVLIDGIDLDALAAPQGEAEAKDDDEHAANKGPAKMEAPLMELEHLRILQKITPQNAPACETHTRGLDKPPPGTSVVVSALNVAPGDIIRLRFGCGWKD